VYKGKLKEVQEHVMRGDGLSAALTATGLFPAFLCGLTAVGELTAGLPKVMEQMAEYYERQAQTQNELKAVMMYPAAVTVLMLLVMGIAAVYVLPNYGRVFAASDVALPAITQVLLGISDFLIAYPYGLLALLSLLAAGAVLLFKSETGDRLKLFFPIYRHLINLHFTQAMTLLLTSGQPLPSAIPICSLVLANKRARRDIAAAAVSINEGRAFWEALSPIRYMDDLLIGMIRVGEETGRLPQTLEKCQIYFAQSYRQSVNRTSKLVEPVITVILGLLLGFMMLAIILPTFALMDIV
jgi:type IV pilus assembly protein PilC